MVDVPVPHLDRPFDYAVPESMAESALPGARVRVRFAGRLADGFVVARLDRADHEGDLRPLERVVGDEPPLTADTLALVQRVAEHCAGTFSDVVRAAVPPRHARAESAASKPATWRPEHDEAWRARWLAYAGGGALVDRVSRGGPGVTRAVWSAAPATSWVDDVVALASSVLATTDGGVLIVAPDVTDVDRLLAALSDARQAGVVGTLTADQGPERRYREFVRVRRGGARLVVGTRSAVFAPVRDLRLIIMWEDGDDGFTEPHAPYWDARDVAALRSIETGCDLVVGSSARSVATQQWCELGWARSIEPTRSTITSRAPVVRAESPADGARDEAAGAARIPHAAFEVARAALASGPVLVSVGRRGYLPALGCQKCREVARCTCGGPLLMMAGEPTPQCSWCGALAVNWHCPTCGSRQFRALAVGAQRTAEEIGRAFPGVPVHASHGDRVLTRVSAQPAIVVATSGAEPEADTGYAAIVILDARSTVQRPTLDAAEDSVRRWFAAARLARPKAPLVITADNVIAPVQALVRWDAPWLATRDLADRTSAGLPPANRLAALFGTAADIDEVVAALAVEHRTMGPVPFGDDVDQQRALVLVDRQHGSDLARELRAVTMARSARASAGVVRVHLDPRSI
jgi:primosomal protein N' (replication factor Y)